MWNWEVAMKTGDTVTVEGADTYQPEGPLTTFFCSGSSRQSLDSWSTRVASYRTADIVAVERVSAESVALNVADDDLVIDLREPVLASPL